MSRSALPLLSLLLLAACGQVDVGQVDAGVQAPSCSPANCAGCCDATGVCQPGVAAQACGISGVACQACPNGCQSGACQLMAEPLPANAKLVFTSSLGLTGDFGGPQSANAHCANAALAAGLQGTFVAWLSGVKSCSSQGCTPFAARDTVTGDGPWYLLCRDSMGKVRRPFLNRAALLTAPSTPLDCDERGMKKEAAVWTGTSVGGGRAPYALCAGYDIHFGNHSSWTETADYHSSVGTVSLTAIAGHSLVANEGWTDSGGRDCSQRLSFYCFQL